MSSQVLFRLLLAAAAPGAAERALAAVVGRGHTMTTEFNTEHQPIGRGKGCSIQLGDSSHRTRLYVLNPTAIRVRMNW